MKTPFSYKVYLAAGDGLRAHGSQKRKGDSTIPYMAHPIAIAIALSRVIEDEEILIAALLHDTLEDTDFPPEEILQKYGARVLSLVQALSEDKDHTMSAKDEKATWFSRKAKMVHKIAASSWEIQLIKFADQLQNLQCLAADLQKTAYAQVASHFNAPLGARVGLYRYCLEYWDKTRMIQQKCPKWLEQFKTTLREVEATVIQHGDQIIPFNPEA